MEIFLYFLLLTVIAVLISLVCAFYNKKFHVFPWINNFNPNFFLVTTIYFVILEISIVFFILKID